MFPLLLDVTINTGILLFLMASAYVEEGQIMTKLLVISEIRIEHLGKLHGLNTF